MAYPFFSTPTLVRLLVVVVVAVILGREWVVVAQPVLFVQTFLMFLYFIFLFQFAGRMSWIMKLFIGLLLLLTFSNVFGNNSSGRKSRQNSGSTTNSVTSSIYTSFNNSINSVSNKTITHTTNLDAELKHLVVDRNTGRVSWRTIYNLIYIFINLTCRWMGSRGRIERQGKMWQGWVSQIW